MLGIQVGDVVSAVLVLVLAPLALAGFRVNKRCKDRRTWWAHAGGFVTRQESFAFSTPASNLGLFVFGAAVLGLFVVILAAAFRHHIAESVIVFGIWIPLMLGICLVVCLPFVLIARWSAKAVSGLKQAR